MVKQGFLNLTVDEQNKIIDAALDEFADKDFVAVSLCSNAAEFQTLKREKRDWCLAQLKDKGLSVRQIERLMEINRGVVQKA